MPTFINEENHALKNKKFPLPKHLQKNLKRVLASYGDFTQNKGYKRLNALVNPEYNKRSKSKKGANNLDYNGARAIKHDMEQMSNSPYSLQRIMNGGEEMYNFVTNSLKSASNQVTPSPNQPKVKAPTKSTVQQVPKVKPVGANTKPSKVTENLKIHITKEQYQRLCENVMIEGNKNTNLLKSENNPNDEIYTHKDEIDKEVQHYREELRGKKIYCCCDDENSSFYEYFKKNFHDLGLKLLTCTSINGGGKKITYDGVHERKEELMGNGSFDSEECINILKSKDFCDIVITNPPFGSGKIHKLIDLILEHKKQFLIIGPVTVAQTRHIQRFIDGQIGYGYKDSNKDRMKYSNTDKTYGNHVWFTNLKGDGIKERKKANSVFKGNESAYTTYDNDTSILYISRGDKIPYDYKGIMAISKTYIHGMYNPHDKCLYLDTPEGTNIYRIINVGRNLYLNTKEQFERILIQLYKSYDKDGKLSFPKLEEN